MSKLTDKPAAWQVFWGNGEDDDHEIWPSVAYVFHASTPMHV